MDEADFSRYFRRMFPRLVAHARRVTDPQTAQDLAARALETLWTKDVPTPVDDEEWQQLDSLTFSILRGLVSNESRADRRRASLLRKVASVEVVSHQLPMPVEQSAPAWFRELAAADREVLALLAEGYTSGEIAGIVGSTPTAVAKRISRVRKRIRDLARPTGGAADA